MWFTISAISPDSIQSVCNKGLRSNQGLFDEKHINQQFDDCLNFWGRILFIIDCKNILYVIESTLNIWFDTLYINFIWLFKSLTEALHKRNRLGIENTRFNFWLASYFANFVKNVPQKDIQSLINSRRRTNNDLIDDFSLNIPFSFTQKLIDYPIPKLLVVGTHNFQDLGHNLMVSFHLFLDCVEIWLYLLDKLLTIWYFMGSILVWFTNCWWEEGKRWLFRDIFARVKNAERQFIHIVTCYW